MPSYLANTAKPEASETKATAVYQAVPTVEVVQADDTKVHVVVEFARYRADGSELARYQSLYVVTREAGRWGIRGRSSFAP